MEMTGEHLSKLRQVARTIQERAREEGQTFLEHFAGMAAELTEEIERLRTELDVLRATQTPDFAAMTDGQLNALAGGQDQ
jgi:ABC-type phosphate transport system auxiliary subunit